MEMPVELGMLLPKKHGRVSDRGEGKKAKDKTEEEIKVEVLVGEACSSPRVRNKDDNNDRRMPSLSVR